MAEATEQVFIHYVTVHYGVKNLNHPLCMKQSWYLMGILSENMKWDTKLSKTIIKIGRYVGDVLREARSFHSGLLFVRQKNPYNLN